MTLLKSAIFTILYKALPADCIHRCVYSTLTAHEEFYCAASQRCCSSKCCDDILRWYYWFPIILALLMAFSLFLLCWRWKKYRGLSLRGPAAISPICPVYPSIPPPHSTSLVLPAPYGLPVSLPYSDSYPTYPQYPAPHPNFEMINNDPPPAYDQLYGNNSVNNSTNISIQTSSTTTTSNPNRNENDDDSGNNVLFVSSPMDMTTMPNVPDYAQSERIVDGRNSSRLETWSVTTDNGNDNDQQRHELQIKHESAENGQTMLVLTPVESSADIVNISKSPKILPARLPPLQLKDDL